MTSPLTRLRGLARAYSNLATGLAPSRPDALQEPVWQDALVGALECMDARRAGVLAGVMEAAAAGFRVVPLGALGIELPQQGTRQGTLSAELCARHAGVKTCPRVAIHDEGVAMQAEVAASLAWAEIDRRAGHHSVRAAKAVLWRRELLRMRLLPTVVAGLDTAHGAEAGLLTVLAWVADYDLHNKVRL